MRAYVFMYLLISDLSCLTIGRFINSSSVPDDDNDDNNDDDNDHGDDNNNGDHDLRDNYEE